MSKRQQTKQKMGSINISPCRMVCRGCPWHQSPCCFSDITEWLQWKAGILWSENSINSCGSATREIGRFAQAVEIQSTLHHHDLPPQLSPGFCSLAFQCDRTWWTVITLLSDGKGADSKGASVREEGGGQVAAVDHNSARPPSFCWRFCKSERISSDWCWSADRNQPPVGSALSAHALSPIPHTRTRAHTGGMLTNGSSLTAKQEDRRFLFLCKDASGEESESLFQTRAPCLVTSGHF